MPRKKRRKKARKKGRSCVGAPAKKKTVRDAEERLRKAELSVNYAQDAVALAKENYRHSETCKEIRRKKRLGS